PAARATGALRERPGVSDARTTDDDLVVEPTTPGLGDVPDAATPAARPGSRARLAKQAGWYITLTLLSLIVLFPVWMILVRALSQPIAYLTAGQPPRPVDPEWDVFSRAFRQGDLDRRLLVSAGMTLIIATAQVVTSVLAAYA